MRKYPPLLMTATKWRAVSRMIAHWIVWIPNLRALKKSMTRSACPASLLISLWFVSKLPCSLDIFTFFTYIYVYHAVPMHIGASDVWPNETICVILAQQFYFGQGYSSAGCVRMCPDDQVVDKNSACQLPGNRNSMTKQYELVLFCSWHRCSQSLERCHCSIAVSSQANPNLRSFQPSTGLHMGFHMPLHSLLSLVAPEQQPGRLHIQLLNEYAPSRELSLLNAASLLLHALMFGCQHGPH